MKPARLSSGIPARYLLVHRGAAMVVSLVLLVILTLVATAGMTTSTLELRMAAGRQAMLSTFQVAENALEAAMTCSLPAKREIVTATDCPSAASTGVEHYDFVLRRDDTETAEVLPEGMSLGSGLKAVHFTIEATATSARGANVQLTQGFYVMGRNE